MYKPLLDISAELFLPNIDQIPPNSITLLETNQRFIEAYMVGLNHEFARELLWREYPTDQRGSYFRQFWDVRGVIDRDGPTRTRCARSCATSRRCTRGRRPPRSATTTTARPGASGEELVLVDPRRAAQAVSRPPSSTRRRRAGSEDRTARSTRARSARWTDLAGRASAAATKLEDAALRGARSIPTSTSSASTSRAEEAQRRHRPRRRPTTPAGSSSSRSGRASRASASTSTREGPLNVWNDLAWPDVLADADKGILQIKPSSPTLTLSQPVGPALQEKRRAVRRRQVVALASGHQRGGTCLHSLPGSCAGRGARQRDAAELAATKLSSGFSNDGRVRRYPQRALAGARSGAFALASASRRGRAAHTHEGGSPACGASGEWEGRSCARRDRQAARGVRCSGEASARRTGCRRER